MEVVRVALYPDGNHYRAPMDQPSLLSDVPTLRERARQHLEEGAVTSQDVNLPSGLTARTAAA